MSIEQFVDQGVSVGIPYHESVNYPVESLGISKGTSGM